MTSARKPIRHAIVISITASLSDDQIARFKAQVREQLNIPDSQEVYVLASETPITISNIEIRE